MPTPGVKKSSAMHVIILIKTNQRTTVSKSPIHAPLFFPNKKP